MRGVTLRVARSTDRLDAVVSFNRRGLGLEELARFIDHDGFDGAVIGTPGAPYHLEFTSRRGHIVGDAPTADNLLVFYIPDEPAWRAAVDRMRDAGAPVALSANPYWERRGVTFIDPDGYRVVLQNAAWSI